MTLFSSFCGAEKRCGDKHYGPDHRHWSLVTGHWYLIAPPKNQCLTPPCHVKASPLQSCHNILKGQAVASCSLFPCSPGHNSASQLSLLSRDHLSKSSVSHYFAPCSTSIFHCICLGAALPTQLRIPNKADRTTTLVTGIEIWLRLLRPPRLPLLQQASCITHDGVKRLARDLFAVRCFGGGQNDADWGEGDQDESP